MPVNLENMTKAFVLFNYEDINKWSGEHLLIINYHYSSYMLQPDFSMVFCFRVIWIYGRKTSIQHIMLCIWKYISNNYKHAFSAACTWQRLWQKHTEGVCGVTRWQYFTLNHKQHVLIWLILHMCPNLSIVRELLIWLQLL